MILAAALVLALQGDPLERIRGMVERGEVADAAEAIRGLPEPRRTREEANVRFRAGDLAGAREAARRATERDPADAEMQLLLGDAEGTFGALEAAAAAYAAAREALPNDPRFATVDPAPFERRIADRERWLRDARAYRKRVEAAERLVGGLVACLAAAIVVTAAALRRKLRAGSADRSGLPGR